MSQPDENPFTRCPACGKKGIQFHFAKKVAGEDGYGCRYCDFWFFSALDTSMDRDHHSEWVAANHHCATCGGFLVGVDDAYICESCGDEWHVDTVETSDAPS